MERPVCNRNLYIFVVAISILNFSVILISRVRIELVDFWPLYLTIAVFGSWYYASGRAIRNRTVPGSGLVRFNQVMEALLFMKFSMIAVQYLNHLSMMAPFPYADRLLAAADRTLGVNWLGYFELVHAQPNLIGLLDWTYDSLTFFCFLTLIGFIVANRTDRARFFVETFFITAVICVVAGMAFPAKAAVAHLVDDLSAYPNFGAPPGVYHMEALRSLRTGSGPLILAPEQMPGLVTFPSFHTAAAVIIAMSFWRTVLFGPACLYTLVMIASTPVFGGHYFADLIAGTAVALAVGGIVALRPDNRKLFRKSGRALKQERSDFAAGAG